MAWESFRPGSVNTPLQCLCQGRLALSGSLPTSGQCAVPSRLTAPQPLLGDTSSKTGRRSSLSSDTCAGRPSPVLLPKLSPRNLHSKQVPLISHRAGEWNDEPPASVQHRARSTLQWTRNICARLARVSAKEVQIEPFFGL